MLVGILGSEKRSRVVSTINHYESLDKATRDLAEILWDSIPQLKDLEKIDKEAEMLIVQLTQFIEKNNNSQSKHTRNFIKNAHNTITHLWSLQWFIDALQTHCVSTVDKGWANKEIDISHHENDIQEQISMIQEKIKVIQQTNVVHISAADIVNLEILENQENSLWKLLNMTTSTDPVIEELANMFDEENDEITKIHYHFKQLPIYIVEMLINIIKNPSYNVNEFQISWYDIKRNGQLSKSIYKKIKDILDTISECREQKKILEKEARILNDNIMRWYAQFSSLIGYHRCTVIAQANLWLSWESIYGIERQRIKDIKINTDTINNLEKKMEKIRQDIKAVDKNKEPYNRVERLLFNDNLYWDVDIYSSNKVFVGPHVPTPINKQAARVSGLGKQPINQEREVVTSESG